MSYSTRLADNKSPTQTRGSAILAEGKVGTGCLVPFATRWMARLPSLGKFSRKSTFILEPQSKT